MNQRRKLIIAIGGSALAAPFHALAQQQGKVWRIGLLLETESSVYAERIKLFKAGMRELGYVEGRDYSIEQRSSAGKTERLPALAAELLTLKVDLILTGGTPPTIAARNVTREIPILFPAAGDPVGSGLVATLSRPGGNVTGLSNGVASELIAKRLDLLRQMLPGMRRIGFLYNPDNAGNAAGLNQFEASCRKLNVASIHAPLGIAQNVPAAFNALKRDKAQGLIVAQSGLYFEWRNSIVEQAAKHRLASIYPAGAFAETGGLISYSSNLDELWRRAAAYVDKIFKGAMPGDLPVEQPTQFDLVVNRKTAKALGITIPNSILLQATKVIE